MNKYEQHHKATMDSIKAGKRVSPLRAIRSFCLECVGYNYEEVARCVSEETCPLWRFRFGKNTTGRFSPIVSKKALGNSDVSDEGSGGN